MRIIPENKITDLSASTENASYPIENALDVHPEKLYKAIADAWKSTITGYLSGVSFIGVINTNADDAALVLSDPMEISWGGDDEWGGSESGVSTTAIDRIVSSSVNIVDVFLYDTRKDSDDGDWRSGALALASSWYNETLNTSTRGATKIFPEVALIVAETDTVTIYDATDSSVPMWMVFDAGNPNRACRGSTTSVSAINGELSVGQEATLGISIINFIKDLPYLFIVADKYFYKGNIEQRNDTLSFTISGTGIGIIHATVNDVAMTVLPDAPIDPETLLPVTTITVPTDTGGSWINDDGTVIDATGAIVLIGGDITPSGFTIWAAADKLYIFDDIPSIDTALTSADYTFDTAGSSGPHISGTIASVKIDGDNIYVATDEGYFHITYDQTTPANSIVNQTTKDWQSGEQHGAIKGAFLADTTEETVGTDITTEHVTNGTFDSDLSSWNDISIGSGTATWDSGSVALYRFDESNLGVIHQDISVTSGQVYLITFDISTAVTFIKIGSTSEGIDLYSKQHTIGSAQSITVKATTSILSIKSYPAVDTETAHLDNISVKAIQSVVENGELSSDRVWNKGTDWTIGSGVATKTAGTASLLTQDALAIGETYLVTYTITRSAGSITPYCGTTAGTARSTADTFIEVMTCAGDTFFDMSADAAFAGTVDVVSVVPLTSPDRSVNDNPMQVVGELTKTAVATGAELVAWSGFDANNYLELDNALFADSLFCYGWEKTGAVWEFNSGVVSTAPVDGISITGTVLHIEGTKDKTLIKLTDGTPSAAQLTEIERTENALFQSGALATLQGSSDNVQALAFCEEKQRLYASTDDGTTVFLGCQAIDYIDSADTPTSDDHVAVTALPDKYAIATAAEAVFKQDSVSVITPDVWANTAPAYTVTITKITPAGILIDLDTAVERTLQFALDLFTVPGNTVELGVIWGGVAYTYKNAHYGMSESRIDNSINDKLSNGARRYKKLSTPKTYGISTVLERSDFFEFMNLFDTYGAAECLINIIDDDTSNWLCFGYVDKVPGGSHDWPDYTKLNFNFTEAV